MRKFTLARLISTTFRRGNNCSTAALRRPARLHAERLEERVVMSANALTADMSKAVPLASPEPISRPALTARPNASWSPTAEVFAAQQAAQSPWERFGSTEELRTWLIEAATQQWGDLFGQPTYGPYYYNHWFLGDSVVLRTQGEIQAMDATTAVQFNATAASTTTNVQVAGVDEADLVETDGEFLYIVSGKDLVIVSAHEGEELSVVSRVQLDRRPVGMYLSGNRLAIVSSSDADNGFGPGPIRVINTLAFDDFAPSSYPKPTTTVTVLDITDRAQPALVQKTELEGRLVSSRAVDGQLRLVVSNDLQLPPPIAKEILSDEQKVVEPPQGELSPIETFDRVMTTDLWWPGYGGSNYVYETKEEYVERVVDEILSSFDARIRSFDADGAVIAESSLLEATSIYRPDSFVAQQTTTVASFDMHGDEAGPVDTASIMTGGGTQVYATADSIYVFAEKTPERNELGITDWNAPGMSSVWRFAVDGDTHSIVLAAQGEFEGTLLNQFAADEKDGYLRIVSQTNQWSGFGQSVVVLHETDGHLNVVGSIEGIATDESLYSVRIEGNRVFLVTFRQIDPLFVVDVSDPTSPKMMGELHIPGFSDYLQPIDATHLLAIGRHANPTGGGVAELQVSIFDVSDLNNPQLTQRYSFGGGSSTVTPATGYSFTRGDGDHHAVSYFAGEQILALPINSLDYSRLSDTPLFEPGHGGLQVFKVDVAAGFTPIGLVEHDTLISRSVRIGDRLLAISSGTVSAHNLMDPDTTLSSVEIGDSDGLTLVELTKYVPVVEAVVAQVWGVEAASSEVARVDLYDGPIATAVMGPLAAAGVGGVSPTSAQSGNTPPARLAAFSELIASSSIDDRWARLLAPDSAAKHGSVDLFSQVGEQSGDSGEHHNAGTQLGANQAGLTAGIAQWLHGARMSNR